MVISMREACTRIAQILDFWQTEGTSEQNVTSKEILWLQ